MSLVAVGRILIIAGAVMIASGLVLALLPFEGFFPVAFDVAGWLMVGSGLLMVVSALLAVRRAKSRP